jgi:hypothetical protein
MLLSAALLRCSIAHHEVHLPTVNFTLQGGREFMGRAAVPLAQFINEEGLEDELWLPLGKGEWTNMEGPVRLCWHALNFKYLRCVVQCDLMWLWLPVGDAECTNMEGPVNAP